MKAITSHPLVPQEQGFTLIELLVVIAIITVLAALAIPQYALYRKRAFDVTAQKVLRVVAVAEEAYFSDFSKYKDCDQSNCVALLPGVKVIEDGVVVRMTTSDSGFSGFASHQKGTGKVFNWN